jgi:hypothetical protein
VSCDPISDRSDTQIVERKDVQFLCSSFLQLLIILDLPLDLLSQFYRLALCDYSGDRGQSREAGGEGRRFFLGVHDELMVRRFFGRRRGFQLHAWRPTRFLRGRTMPRILVVRADIAHQIV